MTTETKAATARRNGALSRGPRTPAGKARSATNALRHGLTAEALVVLPGEDVAAFHELGDRMRATLAPVGELEERLVERVVGLVWRLRRLGVIEAGVILSERAEIVERLAKRDATKEWEEAGWWRPAEKPNEPGDGESDDDEEDEEIGYLHDPRNPHRRKHDHAERRAEKAAAERRTDTAVLGRAFASGADSLGTLSRYEAGLDRALYAALHELQRLQAARAGEPVRVPAVLDVTVTAGDEAA